MKCPAPSRVVPRAQAIDDVLVRIDVGAAPGRTAVTHAVGGLQIPDALFVEEVLAAERADRTEINDVPGELVLQRSTWENVNLFVVPATGDVQFRGAADFARESHAPRTHDAAVGEERDGAGKLRFVRWHVLHIHHSRF